MANRPCLVLFSVKTLSSSTHDPVEGDEIDPDHTMELIRNDGVTEESV